MNEQGASQSGEAGESHDVQLWDPERACRRVSPAEAQWSRGFLRCRPEKWFPGFAAQWMPIVHAIGCEATIADIKTLLTQPPYDEHTFVGEIGGEELILSVDDESARILLAEVVPGIDDKAGAVVAEYLLRRMFFSLVSAWSGAELTSVSFRGKAKESSTKVVASVRLACTINTGSVVVWVGLGQKMVENLDGLWRRQVQSSSRVATGVSSVRLEVAQLGVPPQMLSDYLIKGTVIDLEVRASDTITLRVGNKAWMPGRMVNVGGNFGCEMVPGAVVAPSVAEGTTRLSVELASINLEAAQLAELGQPGAILVSSAPLGARVTLVINQEKVGEARLCVYEGRFAIEVL